MNEKIDNSLKSFQAPNISHQNYQNVDKTGNNYKYQKNQYKFKNIIQDMINNKSNLVFNKIEIQNQINSNLFVPHSFKNKRIYKDFQSSNQNFMDRELKLKRQKIKEEKSISSNIKNNLVNINNNLNENINISPNNQQKNKISNIDNQNISTSKDLNNFSENCEQLDFLRKKRILEKEKEIDNNKLIYDEIKKMYNEYLNNNKNSLEDINIKLFSNENEYFKIQETIIINNEPICVIYLINNHIKKIFSINEAKECNDEEDIKFILEHIKSEIEKIINN